MHVAYLVMQFNHRHIILCLRLNWYIHGCYWWGVTYIIIVTSLLVSIPNYIPEVNDYYSQKQVDLGMEYSSNIHQKMRVAHNNSLSKLMKATPTRCSPINTLHLSLLGCHWALSLQTPCPESISWNQSLTQTCLLLTPLQKVHKSHNENAGETALCAIYVYTQVTLFLVSVIKNRF